MPVWIEANAALGLLAAALWGGGDFSGSIAVKRAGGTVRAALLVVVIGHLLSLPVVSAIAVTHGDAFPHGAQLAWGLGGGAIAGVSLVAFYIALASGHMGSAAAVSGLLCAAVPAVVSAFTDGPPGWRRLLGFLLAGAAIWLIASASEHGATASRRAMVLSTLGGIGFGIYFVSLKIAGEAGVMWAMGTARMGSAATCAVLLLILLLQRNRSAVADDAAVTDGAAVSDGAVATAEASHRMRTLAWIALGAALDTGGNLSYLAATRMGRLDVAAVLSSLYPAGTILLAAAVLKERTTPQQRWGMALALPAVVLIAL